MMSELSSVIYRGHVRHRRFSPVEHEFRYSLFMMYMDLREIDSLFAGRWLWSASRPAVAWFRRRDHFGDPDVPLDRAVRDVVQERTGRRPQGPIGLLTHLRYFGICINPVSFFYCYEPSGASLEAVVAEVHNTPWNERHCYVLSDFERRGSGSGLGCRLPKEFHVSPFMGMDFEYEFLLTPPGESLSVHIENRRDGGKHFDATLNMKREEIDGSALAGVLVEYPFMTLRVFLSIHYQAVRLWLKKVPFHPHPGGTSGRSS
jgi:DUF1365 family protein